MHNENKYDIDCNDERFQKAVILDDGSFIIVGGYDNTCRPLVPDGPDYFVSFIVKYNKDGQMLWEKPIRTDGEWSGIDDAVLLPDNDIILTGDGVSAKIDEDGNVHTPSDDAIEFLSHFREVSGGFAYRDNPNHPLDLYS